MTRWCREHLGTTEPVEQTKQQMKRVLQTRDKRTVRRRWAHLETDAATLGIGGWVTQTRAKLSGLLPAVGSRVLPSTTNGIERFFRGFNRFYNGRCGFHSVRSAKWELLLFLVVYLFTQRATDGVAPIEAIVPEARQMPLYRMINDPLSVLLGVKHVTLPQPIAHETFHECLAA